MFAVAGGILLAAFVGLMLIGLWLVLRDTARFAFRRPSVVVALLIVLAAGAYATLRFHTQQVAEAASSCTGSCLYR